MMTVCSQVTEIGRPFSRHSHLTTIHSKIVNQSSSSIINSEWYMNFWNPSKLNNSWSATITCATAQFFSTRVNRKSSSELLVLSRVNLATKATSIFDNLVIYPKKFIGNKKAEYLSE